jgi:ribonuclease HI
MPLPQSAPEPVVVFTDGSCLSNPGPGGYAALIITREGRRTLAGGYRRTTNNRMEMMGVIAALRDLPEGSHVEVRSDSQYVVKAMQEGWPVKWRERGWEKPVTRGAPAIPTPNADLWQELLSLCATRQVRFTWLRGHAGQAENEECDGLAKRAASGPELVTDSGYHG